MTVGIAPEAAAPAGMTGGRAPEGDMSVGARFAMQGVGKRFGSFDALADVSIAFHGGEVHCLLGENGAGKSTLCNMIFGVHRPSAGSMQLEGAAYAPDGPRDALEQGIAMVHQHFSLVNELTVVDNLLLGRTLGRVDRTAYAARMAELSELYGLALEPYRTVGDLSIGERQRVEIVKCLMLEPTLLILDEPTAVLLPDEIKALMETCSRVAAQGTAVVLVTHKLAEIKQVAHRVSVLRAGRIVTTSDNAADDIDRLVGAMIGRDALAEGEAIPGLSAAPRQSAKSRAAAQATGDLALMVDGVSFADATGAKRLDNVTLTVRPGEIVGIAGVEGNGQSELGAILAGLARPSAGRWFAGNSELTQASPKQITAAGVGIVPEDRHLVAAADDMTLAETILNNRMRLHARFGLIDRRSVTREAEGLIDRFDIRTAGSDVRFGSLSGGNQQKAVLARELTMPGLRFLLAAQPTRGLDVGAVAAVYGLIRDACTQGAGVLLISSELDEILAVADRVLVIYRGGIVNERPADPAHKEAIGAMMAGQKP
ncbi:MAG: ABC transporter ATP-binding protein [Minwuia sp.]|nr:ABC transporter ATP-binding protein [Minwuia sp.]